MIGEILPVYNISEFSESGLYKIVVKIFVSKPWRLPPRCESSAPTRCVNLLFSQNVQTISSPCLTI
jgi:hypothetical protein